MDRAPGLKFHVVGPAQAGVLLDVNSNPQGRFAFHTDVSGIYRMCVKTNTSRWYGTGAVLVGSRALASCYGNLLEKDAGFKWKGGWWSLTFRVSFGARFFSTSFVSAQRVDMEIDVGDVEEDYEELAIREGLTTLEVWTMAMVGC